MPLFLTPLTTPPPPSATRRRAPSAPPPASGWRAPLLPASPRRPSTLPLPHCALLLPPLLSTLRGAAAGPRSLPFLTAAAVGPALLRRSLPSAGPARSHTTPDPRGWREHAAGAAAGRDPPLRRASLLSDGEYGRQGPHATFPSPTPRAPPGPSSPPPHLERHDNGHGLRAGRPGPACGEEPPVRVAMAAWRPRRGPWRFGGSRFAARWEGAGARRRGPRPPRRYCCCSCSPRKPTMMAAASRGRGGVASEGGGRGRGMEGVAAAGHGGRGRASPQGARGATAEK